MNPIVFKYYKNDLFFKLKRPISAAIGLAGLMFLIQGNKSRSASLLMKSYRIYNRNYLLNFIIKKGLINDDILSSLYSSEVNIEGAASRTIIIKYPVIKGNEIKSKGILIITFTSTFGFYLREVNIELLSKHFHVVLEPSWSGYLDADIVGWMHKTSENIYVQATELQDRILLNELRTNLKPVSFGASDWVDFKQFRPENEEKIYDSVYVANTNPIKRIVRYLKAIKNISQKIPDYRGCLICAGWGNSSTDQIKNLATEMGIESNIDMMFSLRKEQMRTVLSKSKINLLLSFKEGSNRSMYESIFVDVPVICLAENIGTNKSYINEYTGMLVSDSALEDTLIDMRKTWRQFSPREWALDNISPIQTTVKLLRIIGNHEQVDTSQWQPQIKVNNPEANYFYHQEADCFALNLNLLNILLKSQASNAAVTSEIKYLETKFDALFEVAQA